MLRLLRVVRPHIVAGGFLGYLAGVLYALSTGGSINLSGFVLGYLIVFFMDLATHFNNDYFDVEVDQNAPFKPFGNRNIFLEHPKLMKPALYASAGSTGISLILAALMTQGTSWSIVGVAVLFNILGWLYSAPPVRLHSRRLGEVTIAIGTGFCVPAVGYIMATGGLSESFYPFMIPLVLYGFVLSLCLQIPDYEVDRKMEKNTIVGLIGRKKTYILIIIATALASLESFMSLPASGLFVWLRWISVVPLVASLSGLALTDSHDDAKTYTMLNISGLFVYLIILDLFLLFNATRVS